MASALRKRPLLCDPLLRTVASRATFEVDFPRSSTPKPINSLSPFSGKSSPTFAPKRRPKILHKVSEKQLPLDCRSSETEEVNRSFGALGRGIGKSRKSVSPLPEIAVKGRPGKRSENAGWRQDAENAVIEKCRKTMETLIDREDRLADVLRSIQDGYESHISSLASELQVLQMQLSAKQGQSNQAEQLLESLQAQHEDLKHQLSSQESERVAHFKRRIRKLQEVLRVLRAKGFPVREVWGEVKTRESDETQSVKSEDSWSDFEDSGRQPLFLCEDSPKSPGKDREIPRIHIPNERAPDFQSEFLSKYSEFSESWRLQITKAQHKLSGDLLK